MCSYCLTSPLLIVTTFKATLGTKNELQIDKQMSSLLHNDSMSTHQYQLN